MMQPASWSKHGAGCGIANSVTRQIEQGPLVDAARLLRKPRLDTITGDSVACGRLTAAHGVERLLWELDKPNPVLALRGCRAGKRKPRIVGSELVSTASGQTPVKRLDGLREASQVRQRPANLVGNVVLCLTLVDFPESI